jgi:predicted nucleic acid-binding protein
MGAPQIVIDTNVLVAALSSRRGASYRLLAMLGAGKFEINVSVPLVLEYEDALSRPKFAISRDDVRDVIDFLCAVGNRHQVFFCGGHF